MNQKMINEIQVEVEKMAGDNPRTVPVKIAKLAYNQGFKVYKCNFEESVQAILTIDNVLKESYRTNHMIQVNQSLSDYKRRYYIALELYLYLKNKEKQPFYHVLKNSKTLTDEEKQAEVFAALLLMPEEPFRAKAKAVANLPQTDRLRVLSKAFGVPCSAVRLRLALL